MYIPDQYKFNEDGQVWKELDRPPFTFIHIGNIGKNWEDYSVYYPVEIEQEMTCKDLCVIAEYLSELNS